MQYKLDIQVVVVVSVLAVVAVVVISCLCSSLIHSL